MSISTRPGNLAEAFATVHMPSMHTRARLLTAAFLFCALARSQATTVIPPTFDDMVARAEVIFEGTVTGTESAWIGEGAQRRIVTYVTFATQDVLKGDAGAAYTIRMLGGTIDGRTLKVSDAPEFKTGDHDILFVEKNGQQFVPLVGIMHGRFRVEHDAVTGRDLVLANDGQPVAGVSKSGYVQSAAAAGSAGLTSAQFKAAIRAKLNNGK